MFVKDFQKCGGFWWTYKGIESLLRFLLK